MALITCLCPVGAVYMNGRVCFFFGGGGGGGDEGEQGPTQLSAAEWNALLPDTPCQPCRVNGTVMRGSSADTWVSVNMLTAITVPNGLTSSLCLLFLSFSFSHSPTLSLRLPRTCHLALALCGCENV